MAQEERLYFWFIFLAVLNLFNGVFAQECTATGGRTPNKKCQFPFTVRGETYTSCTWAVSHLVGNKPWCSTKTDSRGNHINGNVGTCESRSCPIPPRQCGQPIQSRLVDRGADISISQMPWMVSLGRYINGKWEHTCGGSLITNYYVLTAAHCFTLAESYIDLPENDRYKMRLGSSNLTRLTEETEEVRNVKRILRHPQYKSGQIYFDVGLALADKRIEFTDYIRPICLPFLPIDDDDAWSDDLVILAGWGRDNNEVITNQLELDNLRLNSPERCKDLFNPVNLRKFGIPLVRLRQQLPKGLTSDISCAGFEFQASNACEGDSGSPLIRKVTAQGQKPYYEVGFLVSSGVTTRCDFEATLYVRISQREVLTWVQKETDQTPLLMVVGGYNKNVPNGLLNDVELISTTPNNACTKRVRPLPGKTFNVESHIEKESATLGMTGQVTRDTAIVCGGKNGDNNQAKCYKYDHLTNTWDTNGMPPMRHERFLASSNINEDGNLWVVGGASGSESAESTEIYDFNRRRWRRGVPLPQELRDSGLSSQCSVSLNRTHVLMAGGYAGHYTFVNPDRPSEEIFVGGRSLSKAWMYDGYDWEPVPDMSTVRDRPACSLVQLGDGSIRVLVAGGCNGWCAKNPAIASAEMYDPQTRQWSRVANLPEPLSSAKMELLEGKPTIVGGFNNVEENGKLYQYYVNEDTWRAHPTAKMRIPRSSAAVFQVPRSMFPHC